MLVQRGFLVWGIASVGLLGLFLLFVAAGWPGAPNNCVASVPDTCYCEAFDKAMIGAPGVRQKANTWWNLYALGTSLLVAIFVSLDRNTFGSGEAPNLMRSDSWVPDLYIFAVLFLGLGSMWFHASLTEWGGALDGFSMFVFAAFLVFYTVRRIWDSPWLFWIGYLATVAVFTFLNIVAPGEYTSLVLIVALVVAYLFFEVWVWVRDGAAMQGSTQGIALWLSAVASIGAATLFWIFSQTGRALCNPQSAFQPHGMLWHPLAGLMAVLLFFYWRLADDRKGGR